MAFCGEILRRLRGEGIHTAMETNGLFPWEHFAAVCLPYLNLILYDLKIAEPNRHRMVTGAGNEIIRANLCRLLTSKPEGVIVRIPLIPGYTAERSNIIALAGMLRTFSVRRCSLLPYHPHGLAKAEEIGRLCDPSLPRHSMSRRAVDEWRPYFFGIEILDP
jgi:pyruvate formate lyase activating enzyme